MYFVLLVFVSLCREFFATVLALYDTVYIYIYTID